MQGGRLLTSLVRSVVPSLKPPYYRRCQSNWIHRAPEFPPSPEIPSLMGSLVKIFTRGRITEGSHPWTSPICKDSSGSGFIISNRRIITNAHVVSGGTCIRAKKHNDGTLYKVRVEAFGHACDLAVLRIDDENFWKDVLPVEILDNLPELTQTVNIVGFPEGGETICITRGIVSRVNVSTYTHSKGNTVLPVLQVDAAINSGNCGGPVFLGHKVIGVAFQKIEELDNVGYVIPAPILNIFLSFIESKAEIIGFSSLGLVLQSMENQMLRSSLEMPKGESGLLVTHIDENSSSSREEGLRENDILTHVDGLPIQEDGEVMVGALSMDINGYIALKKNGDAISLKVLRKGVVKKFSFCAEPLEEWYINDYPRPSYYIFAGFVFTEDSEYDTVKISQVLEDDINIGYTSFADKDVVFVNGKRVATLEELCEIIAGANKFVRLELEGNLVAVVDLDCLRESGRRLLDFHKIMHGISRDLEDAYPSLGDGGA